MEWSRGPVVGRGSTATVSLATSVDSGEILAVKSVELSRSTLLQKEQYIMSRLSCPFIVNYIGFNMTTANKKPMYNLCMEYVPGGTLHEVIRWHGGRLLEPMIRVYTRHILQGLDYLHTNALLAHCDIKSQNVLIHKDGAKIADFGCAKFMEAASNGGIAMSAFSGTPAFMAPEVARGEEQGYPADVWAVGCTVTEMSTGRTPWNELGDPVSALYRIGFSNEVPEIPSCLSENGKDFLSKCFRRDPKERWTAKELLGHPFLDAFDLEESKEFQNFSMSSPSCVIDQAFWDSVDSAESPQSLAPEGCSSNSPAERIRKLIVCTPSSASDIANWDLEEDWITVRCSGIAESTESFDGNDMILQDETSVATTLSSLHSISVVSDQDPGGSMVDDGFLLQLNVESVGITGNSSGSLENDFVAENPNFDTDNDYSYSFHSQMPLPFLFLCSRQTFHSQPIGLTEYFVKQISQ